MIFSILSCITIAACLSIFSLEGLPFSLRWNPSRAGMATYTTLSGTALPISQRQTKRSTYPAKIAYMITDMQSILKHAVKLEGELKDEFHNKLKDKAREWTHNNIHDTDIDHSTTEMLNFGAAIYRGRYNLDYQALGAIIIETALKKWVSYHGNTLTAQQQALDMYCKLITEKHLSKRCSTGESKDVIQKLIDIPSQIFPNLPHKMVFKNITL